LSACEVLIFISIIYHILPTGTATPPCSTPATIPWISSLLLSYCHALNALTLLLGFRKSVRPVRNWVMGCWCGYLSGARCNWFACVQLMPLLPYHLLLH